MISWFLTSNFIFFFVIIYYNGMFVYYISFKLSGSDLCDTSDTELESSDKEIAPSKSGYVIFLNCDLLSWTS
jgi:hypothetical protein